jgi:hypothetical protein
LAIRLAFALARPSSTAAGETRANKEQRKRKRKFPFFLLLSDLAGSIVSSVLPRNLFVSLSLSLSLLSFLANASNLPFVLSFFFFLLFWVVVVVVVFYLRELGGRELGGALKRIFYYYYYFLFSCVHWCSNQMTFKIGRGARRGKAAVFRDRTPAEKTGRRVCAVATPQTRPVQHSRVTIDL